ncbi:hypothetical protein Tco_0192858, partial [Tanacetum coccineum]
MWQELVMIGCSPGKDNESTQEYILLPLHPHGTRSPVEAVVQDAQEIPPKNSTKDKDDELEKMITQEVSAKSLDDATGKSFEEEKRKIASTKEAVQATSTNTLSTVRPSVSTANTNVSNASTPSSASAEDDSNAFSNAGIFNGAYDDEDVGAVADFNNMDNTIN